MLNRRQIRIKVMQSVFALECQSSDNVQIHEKFLLKSIDELHELYLTVLLIFDQIKDQETQYLKKASYHKKRPETFWPFSYSIGFTAPMRHAL